MKYHLDYFVLIVAVAATASPSPQYESTAPLFQIPLPIQNDLSESFNYFDIELLKAIANAEKDENILLSPISIKSTLAMILEGATGQSASELRSALRLSNDRGLVRQQIQKLLNELTLPSNGVTIESANRVFVSDRVVPVPEYVNILKNYYLSNVTKINVSSPVESADAINYWVRSTTHGLIPSLVSPDTISNGASVVLANALYFNGTWEKSFDERSTQPRCFYIRPNDCSMTYMMDSMDKFKYVNLVEMEAQAIELPYKGGQYSMLVVLPNKIDGINQLVRDILHNPIHKIVSKLEETKLQLLLPKFSIDYNQDLISYLRKLDIFEIFSPEAQLNRLISEGKVQVSNVLHKTKIEVNERGAIAAASTGAVVVPLMGPSKPRIQADHPFLFFIRHVATGTVLFEGRVSRPEQAQTKPLINQVVRKESVLSKTDYLSQQQYPGQILYPGNVNYPHRQNFSTRN